MNSSKLLLISYLQIIEGVQTELNIMITVIIHSLLYGRYYGSNIPNDPVECAPRSLYTSANDH